MNLDKFEDILIDLNEVTLLVGSHVTLKNGETHDVGVKAADAIRELFTPSEQNRHEWLRDTRGKPIGKGVTTTPRCKTPRPRCKTRRAFETANEPQNAPRARKAVSARLTKGVK